MTNQDELPPLPIVQADDFDVERDAFGDREPDPTTPLGTAFLWWKCLADPEHYRTALTRLSYAPADWGDYAQAADILRGLSMLTGIEDNPDDPIIKYARFIDYSGEGHGLVFEDGGMSDFKSLTLIKPIDAFRNPENWWLVWGMSDSYYPSRREVRGN